MDRTFARLSRNALLFSLVLALGLVALPVSAGEPVKENDAAPPAPAAKAAEPSAEAAPDDASCQEPAGFYSTLEDIFGDTEDSLRTARGVAGHAPGVDDAAIHWQEVHGRRRPALETAARNEAQRH
jgi:hypothetical protein